MYKLATTPDPNAIPQKLAIIDSLVAHMEGINPTAIHPALGTPYPWDLRDKVLIGQTEIGEEAGTPVLALLESPNPAPITPADNEAVVRKGAWTLLLQGFVSNDAKHPTRPAYLLEAACQARLARLIALNDQGLPLFPDEALDDNLCVVTLTIGQGVVRPPSKQVSKTAYFYIPLVFELGTDVSNPYVIPA